MEQQAVKEVPYGVSSWESVLNKREAFRKAFDGFDLIKVASYDDIKLNVLCLDTSIIRNRQKIKAAVINANAFMDIQSEWGSFNEYIWHFTHGKTVYEVNRTASSLSDMISADLRRRGMKFVGSTVIYSYLQAIGIINFHENDCFLHTDKADVRIKNTTSL